MMPCAVAACSIGLPHDAHTCRCTCIGQLHLEPWDFQIPVVSSVLCKKSRQMYWELDMIIKRQWRAAAPCLRRGWARRSRHTASPARCWTPVHCCSPGRRLSQRTCTLKRTPRRSQRRSSCAATTRQSRRCARPLRRPPCTLSRSPWPVTCMPTRASGPHPPPHCSSRVQTSSHTLLFFNGCATSSVAP